MMYLPAEAKLLFQNVQQANQQMLADAPAREEEATGQTEGLTVIGPASAPYPLELMSNSAEAHQSVQEALEGESTTYRLGRGRHMVEVDALTILQSDILTQELIGPSRAPPPVLKTEEDKKSEEEALRMAALLSLQSETEEPGTFIIKQETCTHGRILDECRTCTIRENWAKTSSELIMDEFTWDSCWREDGHLDNAITCLRHAVVHTI